MPVTTVPSFVPVDAATRLAALEASFPLRDYMAQVRSCVSGGGVLSVNTDFTIKWTQRFILMGAGRDPATCPGGYFDVTLPPDGTVIPRVGGTGSVTVAGGRIQMSAWDTLYYIVPLGGAGASVPANFRMANYTLDFTAPYNWLQIVSRNDDNGMFKWCNGANFTVWYACPLVNGWVDYGDIWEPSAYRRDHNTVRMRGLIRAGNATSQVTIFTLPVGFRPNSNKHIIAPTGVPSWCFLNIMADGRVMSNTAVSSAWLGLNDISWTADA